MEDWAAAGSDAGLRRALQMGAPLPPGYAEESPDVANLYRLADAATRMRLVQRLAETMAVAPGPDQAPPPAKRRRRRGHSAMQGAAALAGYRQGYAPLDGM